MIRRPHPLSLAAAALAATALTACQSGGGTTAGSSSLGTTPATTTTAAPSVSSTKTAASTATSDPSTTRSTPPASTTSAAPTTSHSSGPTGATQVVVVRPVTAAGLPVAGYTVKNEGMQVMCGDGSLAAADNGIAQCGASAAYLPACWKSTDNTVLCLRNATKKVLVREQLVGAWGTPTKRGTASPLNMRLTDGTTCMIRVGGAWGQVPQHPSWLGFASCSNGGDVFGPPNGDGVDRTANAWTVHLYNEATRSLTTKNVALAYLVGTAG